MRLYRIAKTIHAHDLSGMGAKITGGQWNQVGIPCIYLSESRALSLLEYTVHTGVHTLPAALSVVTLNVPAQSMRALTVSELPVNWLQRPPNRRTRDFGTSLLIETGCLLLKFPSLIINQEFCFVLNPLHPLIDLVKITDVTLLHQGLRLR